MKCAASGLMLLALCAVASAQYPQFIGPGDPTAVAVTPVHHITVYTGGFDQPHPKWDKYKTQDKCLSFGFPADQCSAAQIYAQALNGWSGPSTLLAEIDAAADHVVAVWQGCGGGYSSFAGNFNWSSITVVVKDSIFQNPVTGVWSGGLTIDNGHTVWVVNEFFNGWFCCQPNVTLATMGGYAQWECGNALWRNYAGNYKDIGDNPPCS